MSGRSPSPGPLLGRVVQPDVPQGDSSEKPMCRGNGRDNGHSAWRSCASECLGVLETLASAVLVTCTRQQLRTSLLGVELALKVVKRRCRCRSLQYGEGVGGRGMHTNRVRRLDKTNGRGANASIWATSSDCGRRVTREAPAAATTGGCST
jgi:hypothetical protein